MNPLILGPLLDAAGKIFDKIFPDETSANKAKAELMLAAQSQDFQLAMEQIKTNQEEAKHASVFVAGWRPFIGWVCGAALAWHFIGYDLAAWIVAIKKSDIVLPVISSDNLMELTFALLGLAGMRSWEKAKGITK